MDFTLSGSDLLVLSAVLRNRFSLNSVEGRNTDQGGIHYPSGWINVKKKKSLFIRWKYALCKVHPSSYKSNHIYMRCGGLTYSVLDPEQIWCQKLLTESWLERDGLPVGEKNKSLFYSLSAESCSRWSSLKIQKSSRAQFQHHVQHKQMWWGNDRW